MCNSKIEYFEKSGAASEQRFGDYILGEAWRARSCTRRGVQNGN